MRQTPKARMMEHALTTAQTEDKVSSVSTIKLQAIVARLAIVLCLALVFTACATGKIGNDDAHCQQLASLQKAKDAKDSQANDGDVESVCPRHRLASLPLKGIQAQELERDTWLSNAEAKLDDVVMSRDAIATHNGQIYDPLYDIFAPLDQATLGTQILERMASFERKFASDTLMIADGSQVKAGWFLATAAQILSKPFGDHMHIALAETMIHCAADTRDYIKSIDGEARFSRNHCSILRAQEPLEILSDAIDGLYLVRTGYVWGFIRSDTPLSPALSEDERTLLAMTSGRYMLKRQITWHTQILKRGAFIAGDKDKLYLGTKDGLFPEDLGQFYANTQQSADDELLIDSSRVLTRRAWIDGLFLFIGDPYGWGGHDGWRDCSSLIFDLARSFGLRLPRNSKDQARQMSLSLDVEGLTGTQKLELIEQAATTGIVLLHFPGHIMAYLGMNKDGEVRIFHAFSEYFESCSKTQCDTSDRNESLLSVDRVTVSDLLLGEGTSRGSLLERLSVIAVLFETAPLPLTTPPTKPLLGH